AVGVHAADRAGAHLRAGEEPAREADALVLRQLAARLPERMVANRIERLPHADPRPRGAVEPQVAALGGVADTQVERIQLQLLGELVHQRLERKGALGRGRAAVRARPEAVGADAEHLDVPGLDPVWAGE